MIQLKLGVLKSTEDTLEVEPQSIETPSDNFPPMVREWLTGSGDIELVEGGEKKFDAWLVFLPVQLLRWQPSGGRLQPRQLGRGTFWYNQKKDSSDLWKKYISDQAMPKPMLFIGLLDTAPGPDVQEARLPIGPDGALPVLPNVAPGPGSIEALARFLRECIDPRLRFFDSCIWFQYAPLPQLAEQLPLFLASVKNNEKVFSWVVAQEFREFQVRLFNQSFIHRFSESRPGQHGGSVTPFGFHSEAALLAKAQKVNLPWLMGLKWRLMLIDDFANKPMTTRNGGDGMPSKGAHIKDLLERSGLFRVSIFDENGLLVATGQPPSTDGHCLPELEVYAAPNFEVAFELLAKSAEKSFDGFLLDYLFIEEEAGKSPRKEFAEAFLKRWLTETGDRWVGKGDDRLQTGALRKARILPISVYQNALTDKLRELGIGLNHKFWSFSSGADPVSTPGLFCHELTAMLRQQVDEMTNGKGGAPVSRLLHLFGQLDGVHAGNVKTWATKTLPKWFDLNQTYQRLYQFRERSPFAMTVAERYYFGTSPRALNDLQYLVWMLAFDSREEHPKMDRAAAKLNRDFRELFEHPQIQPAWKSIQNYIASLKN